MKKIWLFLLLTCIGFISFTFADLAGYTIHKYDVEMSLREDGSMEVQETIEVNFSEARHGIYRTIPYYSPSWRYTVIQQMQAIGDPASFSTENAYQLKIGSASSTLIGDHTYHISYIVKNAIAGFGEGTGAWTELYWNVIWTERATTIDTVNFTLYLPKETAFSSGDYYLVYGRAEEKKTEWSQLSFTDGKTFVGSIDVRLGNNEGVTIGVKFPSDYFSLSEEYLNITGQNKVPTSEVIWWFLMLAGKVLGGIIVIVLIIFGWYRCIKFIKKITRRLKEKIKIYLMRKPVTIYYTPPKNVQLPLAGNLYGVSDARIFTALIYDLARKGYLTVETSSSWFFPTAYYLHKKNAVVGNGIDQQLMRKIFRVNTVFNMNTIDYWKFQAYKYIWTDPQFTPTYLFRKKQTVYFLKILPETRWELNEQGQQLYEEIRGFAYFLAHVEKPRLQQMIKDNPHYIDEVLPRAVLVGVETRFLEAVEEIVSELYIPEWYIGELSAFSGMVTSVSRLTKPPMQPSNSTRGSGWGGSSGFSGWWGSSGWWGGGGGWGSR